MESIKAEEQEELPFLPKGDNFEKCQNLLPKGSYIGFWCKRNLRRQLDLMISTQG